MWKAKKWWHMFIWENCCMDKIAFGHRSGSGKSPAWSIPHGLSSQLAKTIGSTWLCELKLIGCKTARCHIGAKEPCLAPIHPHQDSIPPGIIFSILFLLGLVALALFMAWAWAAVMALAHGCHALYMSSHEGFWCMADMDSESAALTLCCAHLPQ